VPIVTAPAMLIEPAARRPVTDAALAVTVPDALSETPFSDVVVRLLAVSADTKPLAALTPPVAVRPEADTRPLSIVVATTEEPVSAPVDENDPALTRFVTDRLLVVIADCVLTDPEDMRPVTATV